MAQDQFQDDDLVLGPIVSRWILSRTDISSDAKLVLAYVKDWARFFAEKSGGKFRRSRATIAKDLGMSTDRAKRAIAELVLARALARIERRGFPSVLAVVGPGAPVPDHPGAGAPTTWAPVHHERTTVNELQTPPSRFARRDPIEAMSDTKPPFRSVVTWLQAEFSKNSPSGSYACDKVDRAILKKMWDEVESKAEIARVFSAAALLCETDRFWQGKWSVKFVYAQFSMLRNQREARDDDRDRIGQGHWEAVLRECTSFYGLGVDPAERLLRASGLGPDESSAATLARLFAHLTSRGWREKLLATKPDRRERLLAHIVSTVTGTTETAGGADLI